MRVLGAFAPDNLYIVKYVCAWINDRRVREVWADRARSLIVVTVKSSYGRCCRRRRRMKSLPLLASAHTVRTAMLG